MILPALVYYNMRKMNSFIIHKLNEGCAVHEYYNIKNMNDFMVNDNNDYLCIYMYDVHLLQPGFTNYSFIIYIGSLEQQGNNALYHLNESFTHSF